MTYRSAEGQHVVRMEPRIPGLEYGPTAAPFFEADAPPEGAPAEDEKMARRAATKRWAVVWDTERNTRMLEFRLLMGNTLQSV